MSDQRVKEVKIQLLIASVLLLIHAHMFAIGIYELGDSLIYSERWAMILFLVTWAALVTLVSAWFLILFSLHVKRAVVLDGGLVIQRFLASRIHQTLGVTAKKGVPVVLPSLKAPYYLPGNLLVLGTNLLVIPDDFQQVYILIDRISK